MYLIVVSTNRKDSYSAKLGTIYTRKLSALGVENEVLDLKNLPKDVIASSLYENSGKNSCVNDMTELVKKASKIIFIIPEYNGSFPGVLKLFIDALPYPNPLKGKKSALVGLSSSGLSAVAALSHFTDVMHYLGCEVFSQKVRFTGVSKIVVDGEISVKFYEDLVDLQLKSFIEY